MDFVSAIRNVPNPQLTLVLMHGLGSDERDMAGLADMLDGRVEVVCLRAPLEYGPGFAWFDIQWTLRGIEVNMEEFWSSVGDVVGYLRGLEASRLVVGGFSQGAMMSLGVIARELGIAEGAVLLSGRGAENEVPTFEGKIFHAHGLYDDVIPIRDARLLHESLKGLEERYEYHEYEMGHWICDEELRDINRWLANLIEVE